MTNLVKGFVFSTLAMGAVAAIAWPAWGFPIAGTLPGASIVEKVEGGCGPGWHPNPWGHCVPWHHHDDWGPGEWDHHHHDDWDYHHHHDWDYHHHHDWDGY